MNTRISIFSIFILLTTVFMGSGAIAHDYKVGALEIIHPWARASAGAAKSGAAYMVISNDGTETDRLIAVETPVSKKTSIHTTHMEDGVMKMRPVDGVEVAPEDSAILEPGGFHIMLMGLKEKLEEGNMFPMTLTFEKSGTVEIMVKIMKAGTMDGMDHN